jgi:hypothetical protein
MLLPAEVAEVCRNQYSPIWFGRKINNKRKVQRDFHGCVSAEYFGDDENEYLQKHM